jgi:uncharacterized protein (DUF849 family)
MSQTRCCSASTLTSAAECARAGLWTRIGLEDVLALPGGRPAARSNDLVREAVALAGRS